jgi:hypothetical protein
MEVLQLRPQLNWIADEFDTTFGAFVKVEKICGSSSFGVFVPLHCSGYSGRIGIIGETSSTGAGAAAAAAGVPVLTVGRKKR